MKPYHHDQGSSATVNRPKGQVYHQLSRRNSCSPAKIEAIKDWTSPKSPDGRLSQFFSLAVLFGRKQEAAFTVEAKVVQCTKSCALPERKRRFIAYCALQRRVGRCNDGRGKRYVGPFKVIERVGEVAYKLELPEELSRVHNTFHVAFDHLRDALSVIFGLSVTQASDEEIEGPMKDQPLSADASPTALSPGYIADSDPEKDKEDTP
ncbi:hypothetical protein Tco_0252399 [Tanacetum coccineum]